MPIRYPFHIQEICSICIVFYVCNIPAFSDRGVNISILRHEAEFYGITPLGMA